MQLGGKIDEKIVNLQDFFIFFPFFFFAFFPTFPLSALSQNKLGITEKAAGRNSAYHFVGSRNSKHVQSPEA